MAIKYSTGKQSTYPTKLDSFDIYQNTTDTISSTGMNRMSAAALQLEKDLINAPTMLDGNMLVSACTINLSSIQFNTEYTITLAASNPATSAFTAMVGASNLGAGTEAILMLDARPTSANFGNDGILDTTLDHQTSTREGFPLHSTSSPWNVKVNTGGLSVSSGTANGLTYERIKWTGTPPASTVVLTSVVDLPGSTNLDHFSLLFMYIFPVAGKADWGVNKFDVVYYSDASATTEIGRTTFPTSGAYAPGWAGAGDYTLPLSPSLARTSGSISSIGIATKSSPPAGVQFDMFCLELWSETTHYPIYNLSWRWDTAAPVPTIKYKLLPGPTTAFLMSGEPAHDAISQMIISVVGFLPTA